MKRELRLVLTSLHTITRSPRSDLRAQTVGYEWASFRRAYTLKEALLLLIRGGDRVGDNEVGSISAGFSRLSLSSASHTSHTLSSRRVFHTLHTMRVILSCYC